MDPDAFAA